MGLITSAWRYYFVALSSAVLIFTWSYRSFMSSGDENALIGYFILFGVITSLAVYSLRRSVYRQIMNLEPKTYKAMMASKGKQRPLEMAREKDKRYSNQVEDLIQSYNIFRYFALVLLIIFIAADAYLLR